MLFHQYGAGLCMLAMLAEMWSGLEPMHLFYVLDFHAFFVFNCVSAVVYIVYWTALLLRSVVAKYVPLCRTITRAKPLTDRGGTSALDPPLISECPAWRGNCGVSYMMRRASSAGQCVGDPAASGRPGSVSAIPPLQLNPRSARQCQQQKPPAPHCKHCEAPCHWRWGIGHDGTGWIGCLTQRTMRAPHSRLAQGQVADVAGGGAAADGVRHRQRVVP